MATKLNSRTFDDVGRVPPLDESKVADVIRRTLDEPSLADATHWTVRDMAKPSDVSPAKVHEKIWQGRQPGAHRYRLFKLSNDPAFVDKTLDVFGLYVDPPAHTVVLSTSRRHLAGRLRHSNGHSVGRCFGEARG